MKKRLEQIRKAGKAPLGRTAGFLLLFLAFGAGMGTAAKLFDLYAGYLGEIFSQMSVWILLGTVIAVRSGSPKRAAGYVPAFCGGMLIAYYTMAHCMDSPYSITFVLGWTVFSLLFAFFAVLAWYAGGRGWPAAVLAAGILLFTAAAAVLLFDKLRISDAAVLLLLGILLSGRRQLRDVSPGAG